jgi:hypothetical protein
VLLRRTLPLALGLVAVLAACGPTQGPPDDFYEAQPTRECLEDAGFRVTTDPDEIGLITLTAPAGGFRAYYPGGANSLERGGPGNRPQLPEVGRATIAA